jgi:Tol biopolymer transport system component
VSRGLLAAVAFTLVFGATAAARTSGQEASPRTLSKVNGRVDGLAQDGNRIAWLKSERDCRTPPQVLTLPSHRAKFVGSRLNCGYSIHAIAVGRQGRVLWEAVPTEGNTYFAITVLTAAADDPRTRALRTSVFDKSSNPDEFEEPEALPMAADGTAMLFYAECAGGETCTPRVRPGIYRLAGNRSRLMTKIKRPVALAVSGRRFAVVTNSIRCCNFKPVWSHDGTRIAWIYHGKLWTIRADGTGDHPVAADIAEPQWASEWSDPPTWSPDDTQLVFVRMGRDKKRFWPPRSLGLFRVGADGTRLRRLAAGRAPAWSPDGKTIAFVRGNAVFGIRPDGTGERRLTTAPRKTQAHLSWSPDSTRIAVSRGSDVYIVRADGAGETRLTRSSRAETDPTWSPDGTRIAYVDGGTIAIVNAEGTGARRLPRASGISPAWSPDSKSLVFATGDFSDSWLVNADGSGRRRLVLPGLRPDAPAWSPDGNRIVIGEWAREGYEDPQRPGIRLVSPSTGKATKIAPVPRSSTAIRDTRTGRLVKRFTIHGYAEAAALGSAYVAFLTDHDPGIRIELYNLNGQLRAAAAVPRSVRSVSAAGRTIVFATSRLIRRLDARTGVVTTLVTPRREPVGASIEGRRVVWAENGRGSARIRAVTVP